jgi:FkbM family methyltransferase
MPLVSTLRHILAHPLNRGQPLAALCRFATWQIGSRLLGTKIVHPWIDGARVIVESGDQGMTGNIYCGLHELADMAYLLHVLGPDDCFVDIGANVGSYTVLACAARGARGYSVEPVPATFARLEDNLRINDLGTRVTALNIGLSDQPGELRFSTDQDCMNHVVSEGGVAVRVARLDDVLGEATPSLIKIDVEGFETQVLGGAAAVLARPSLHSVIMELNGSGARYGIGDEQILQIMQAQGFATYRYDPFTRSLTSLGGKNEAEGNTLFIRDLDRVRAKIAAAAPIEVNGHRL